MKDLPETHFLSEAFRPSEESARSERSAYSQYNIRSGSEIWNGIFHDTGPNRSADARGEDGGGESDEPEPD